MEIRSFFYYIYILKYNIIYSQIDKYYKIRYVDDYLEIMSTYQVLEIILSIFAEVSLWILCNFCQVSIDRFINIFVYFKKWMI